MDKEVHSFKHSLQVVAVEGWGSIGMSGMNM